MIKYLYYSVLFIALFIKSTKAHDELTIAVIIEPPFTNLVNGKLIGEHVALAKLLAKAVNLTPTFLHCPFARCLAMVESGQADMMFGLKKLATREKNLIFIEPCYQVQYHPLRFFISATNTIEINSLNDLDGLIVGTLRGASYFDQFDHSTRFKKVEITSREQLVQMLLKGHVDTFIEREESILPLLSSHQYQQKLSIAKYTYDDPVKSYIAISKKSHITKYAAQLSDSLAVTLESGEFAKIIAKNRAAYNK